jgi:hypothetical protein
VLDELTASAGEQRRRPVERPGPHAAEAGEHGEGSPFVERRDELGAEVLRESLHERAERVVVGRRQPEVGAERLAVHRLAGLDSLLHILDDCLVLQILEACQDRTDDPPFAVSRQRSEEERVLDVRRSADVPKCPLHPLGRHVVAVGESREPHGGHPAVVIAPELDDLVDRSLFVGETVDGRAEQRRRLERGEPHLPPVFFLVELRRGRARRRDRLDVAQRPGSREQPAQPREAGGSAQHPAQRRAPDVEQQPGHDE